MIYFLGWSFLKLRGEKNRSSKESSNFEDCWKNCSLDICLGYLFSRMLYFKILQATWERKLQNVSRPKRTKPPGTHSKSPHGHQKSFKIAKKSNRTSQHRYVRNFYLAFTCRFEFQHICERLCIMVAHLDRLMNVVTNENGVLRRWHTLYVFESHKVSKTKVLNKSKKYHAME